METENNTTEANEVGSNDSLAVLTALVDSLPGHSGTCIQRHPDYGFDKGIYWLERDGKSVVTEDSCVCTKPYKAALRILDRFDKPVDENNMGKNEALAKLGS